MKTLIYISLAVYLMLPLKLWALEPSLETQEEGAPTSSQEKPFPIFDDRMLLDGYAQKFSDLSKEILLEMIKDDTLTAYVAAAAVRVFKEKYSAEVVSKEKNRVAKILIYRFNRDNSPFVAVEIMHTLCLLDRYQYFASMVPGLIQKLEHYNTTVNEMAYNSLDDIIKKGNDRPREARIIFNTLRKILFLSRKRLAGITDPGIKLSYKLKILRWSIKVLGNQELKKLPKEVINLL